MKGFVTKRDTRHILKSWDKGQKPADFFLFIYVILKPLNMSSVYIFNVSNKTKVVGGKDYWNLLFQLEK